MNTPTYNIQLTPFRAKQSISILIAAYQTENYIEETLDSIENQSYFINNNDFEVLVGVDGCEKTLNKLISLRKKYRNLRFFMMSKNMGTYVTFNTLFEISRYENILRFDSDDVMNHRMVEAFMNNINKFDLIRSQYFQFQNSVSNVRLVNDYANGVVLFKRIVFDECGGYQPWVCAADTEFLQRAKRKFSEGLLKKPLFSYRQHNNSLTRRVNMSKRLEYHSLMNTNDLKIERVVNEYEEK